MASLVIAGGNGFIGSSICRIGVENGHDVAAFGRSGRPSLTPARHPWTQEVEWRAADIFEPDTWRDLLEGADAVLHSIGTIRDDPGRNGTFDRVNAESAALLAEEALEADVDALVYLSAQDNPPFVSDRFLASKRRAERELSEYYSDLRAVFLRPNLVFGPGLPGSAILAAALVQLQGCQPEGYASVPGRPLPVESVAATAIQAATSPTLEGSLSVSQIEDIGRTSGLIDPEDVSEPAPTTLFAALGGAALASWLLYRWWS